MSPKAALPARKPISPQDEIAKSPAPKVSQPSQDSYSAPAASSDLDSDEPDAAVPPGITCRRRACHVTSTTSTGNGSRDGEECIYHPGQALFHEGSKGWTCCKRRVLEFDEFLKIEGCKKRKRHLFAGKKRDESQEQTVKDVRHDFYQTPSTVIASLFLKKIDKSAAKVEFSSSQMIMLDLPTTDMKRYQTEVPTFGPINTKASTYKILGTKLELTLVKADGASWPVLRSDEKRSGDIIQVGQAGRA